MVHYKLHYFDFRGLGEAIRLLLTYADQPFEDARIQMMQWPFLKSRYLHGKVPVLEVDGKQLAQSGAILRYLANKFGLAGKDEWEKAKVDELYDYFKDVRGAELGQHVANLFSKFVKLLQQSGSGFFAPSGLTYVDFVVAEYFQTLRQNNREFYNYPELNAFVERVYALPQLKKYLAYRKDTHA